MKRKISILISICLWGLTIIAADVDDSTGVILRDNQVYILHKVDAGQGLFAVARRYKVHWTTVRDANPGSETSLNPGKILYVPTGKTESQFWGKKKPVYSKDNNTYTKPKEKAKPEKERKSINEESNSSPKTSFTVFYTVKKGETLFSIAEKFNTTVEFLKQLNNLKTERVKDGTDILVPFTEETKDKVKEKTETPAKEKIVETKKEETIIDTEAEPIVEKKKDEKKKDEETKDDDKTKENSEKDKDEILIEKKEETKKVEKEIEDISKKIEEEKSKEPEVKEKTENSDNIENILKEAEKNKDDGSKTEETSNEESAKTPWKYKIEVESYPEYDIEKVSETGQGKVMDDKTIDQTKDWVIHHNAPENTIILITNPVNNKTVYAKVVKNFNRSDDNQVIIYITKNTADFLELSKKDKFNIKLSFAK